MPQLSPALATRFAYHPANTVERQLAHENVRTACAQLAAELDTNVPDGREKALALTNLEQVMFWANAAVARQPEGDDEPPAPVLALVA